VPPNEQALAGHAIIAIGASTGGIDALSRLVQGLPADLPAALFVVQHMDRSSPGHLPDILDRVGPLRAAAAVEGEPILSGRIYVARPDLHLLVKPGRIHLARTARENRARPAVDPLFRSAARSYGRAVVGVVLTGALDDGTGGLLAIKARGGVAIVQDPADAVCADMPRSALRQVAVDHCLPLAGIPPLLARLVGPGSDFPAAIDGAPNGDNGQEDGESDPLEVSGLSCPSCHGSLWERKQGERVRFQCRTGHAFSVESLLAQQDDDIESALWSALRALQESAATERRLAGMGDAGMALRHGENATTKEQQAHLLRRVLLDGSAS